MLSLVVALRKVITLIWTTKKKQHVSHKAIWYMLRVDHLKPIICDAFENHNTLLLLMKAFDSIPDVTKPIQLKMSIEKWPSVEIRKMIYFRQRTNIDFSYILSSNNIFKHLLKLCVNTPLLLHSSLRYKIPLLILHHSAHWTKIVAYQLRFQ